MSFLSDLADLAAKGAEKTMIGTIKAAKYVKAEFQDSVKRMVMEYDPWQIEKIANDEHCTDPIKRLVAYYIVKHGISREDFKDDSLN